MTKDSPDTVLHRSTDSPLKDTRTPLRDKDSIRRLLWTQAGYEVSETPVHRTSYLSWSAYFMGVAVLSAQRSKFSTPSGACLVDPATQRIVGMGYKGLPQGCHDHVLPSSEEDSNFLHSKETYAIGASTNAIMNRQNPSQTSPLTLYCTHFPPPDCAKCIVQSHRITKVVYLHKDVPQPASDIMFQMAGLQVEQLQEPQEIVLDFGVGKDPSREPNEQPIISDDASGSPVSVQNEKQDQERQDQQTHRDLLLEEANFDPVTAARPCQQYISWEDYFMSIALLSAQRSKDPSTQVGACLVDPKTKRILSTGYNGFPAHCSDQHLPWQRSGDSSLQTKYPFVCHAEVNCLIPVSEHQGATLYVALFPCHNCAKLVIQAGVRKIVFLHDKYHDTDSCRASRILLRMAGVECVAFVPDQEQLRLSLN